MIEDPIKFEVISNSLISCAREMSQALRRSAFSPNIKERRDCSCAIFDKQGRLVSQSKDIPVHLGAMPLSVKACINKLKDEMARGTMALLNDPFSGGSHLPDLTLVAPVYNNEELVGFVANRAHHADVGGSTVGSMPGLSTSIHEEGVLIEPRIIVRGLKLQLETVQDLLEATRTKEERLGDLSAQIAANNVGLKRLHELGELFGWTEITDNCADLILYSHQRMKNELENVGAARGQFTDYMDSDSAGSWDIPISVEIEIDNGKASVNFEGTANQVEGNINCPIASTLSGVYYTFIALFGEGIPTNEGCWSVLDIAIPEGSLLHPKYPAAVSAGNVETTQRIVDVALGALSQIVPDRVPAASQGTMNNLSIGGIDHRTGKSFAFYETIGGGTGSARAWTGTDAIHSHMTNTLNTPIEALETSYPLRIHKYSIRMESGGKGKNQGGNGIIREIEVLSDDCVISIQSERRNRAPWGLQGGQDGLSGLNMLLFEEEVYYLQAKSIVIAPKGAKIRILTPGGGGYGIE